MSGYFHFPVCSTASCLIIIKIILCNGKSAAVRKETVFFFGHRVAMRRFLLVDHEKGFILISFSQPVDSKIGREVSYITFCFFANTILNKIRIIIFSLPGQYIPVIKPYGIRDQMPFANNGSLVACIMQNCSNGLLFVIKFAVIIRESVYMTVLAGKHYGTTGPANGISNKCPVK